MCEIVKKEIFSDEIKLYEIKVPEIAKKAQPGQFVIVRTTEKSERIPLTIADFNREAETITLVVQEVGKSTIEMGKIFKQGDRLSNIIGPLGIPSHIDGYKKVICVGGGLGIAPIYPITKAFYQSGAEVTSIIGARTEKLLIFENKMRRVSHHLMVTTDDGSYGRKALVTEPLKELLEKDSSYDKVMAIGPAVMMKFVAQTTQPFNIKTIVSLNSIMVDGTGMCGACRVEVGGKTKFACVDGPEFDGHQVDFDLLIARLNMYLDEEKTALERYRKQCGGSVDD